MLIDRVYEVENLLYLALIGFVIGVLIGGAIAALISGIYLIVKDDPEYIGRVPYSHRIDGDGSE